MSKPGEPRMKDVSGHRFGRLTAVKQTRRYLFSDGRSRGWQWLFRCDCGQDVERPLKWVTRSANPSCGCLKREIAIGTATRMKLRHGHAANGNASAEYRAWEGMRRRCTLKSDKSFKNYGARGITVCERWALFENFFEDMGQRPSPKHSIDRIDNDGNYEPGNCRWATTLEQANNRRSSRKITINGTTQSVAQWARATNLLPQKIYNRLNAGWLPHEAIKS